MMVRLRNIPPALTHEQRNIQTSTVGNGAHHIRLRTKHSHDGHGRYLSGPHPYIEQYRPFSHSLSFPHVSNNPSHTYFNSTLGLFG